jgi:hypothetical protein
MTFSVPAESVGPQDNRLELIDQATLLSMRATGRGQLMQMTWLYEHPVDYDGLKRFHHNLGYGLYGRRIERSPLPFGRHRWVSALGPACDIDFAETPRPRAELTDWIDERAQLPIDPETGPAWRLSVLPLTDGSTAISVVGSHCIGDGGGGLFTMVCAVNGLTRDFGYPAPGSRSRLRGLITDTRQTVRDLPAIAKAAVAVTKLVLASRRQNRESAPATVEAALGPEYDEEFIVPAITIFVDAAEWDARANALGGNSYSLLAGLAAKFAERIDRREADGSVTLLAAVSQRTLEDTRANAMSLAKASVDPEPVTEDLSGARAALKAAVTAVREAGDDMGLVLPLIPLIPKRVMKHAGGALFGFGNLPVACSNMGDLDASIGRPDGTQAEYVYLRGVDRQMTRREHERANGELVLVSGRIAGKVSVGVIAYRPGAENSKAALRELAAKTLAEFELTGVID